MRLNHAAAAASIGRDRERKRVLIINRINLAWGPPAAALYGWSGAGCQEPSRNESIFALCQIHLWLSRRRHRRHRRGAASHVDYARLHQIYRRLASFVCMRFLCMHSVYNAHSQSVSCFQIQCTRRRVMCCARRYHAGGRHNLWQCKECDLILEQNSCFFIYFICSLCCDMREIYILWVEINLFTFELTIEWKKSEHFEGKIQ
jgi:hypothetical protein